ncbi:MAG TPA: VOC family protein [Chitinophagaceae bacterium]|nr:VOC family protein [Chitinophagaceae bacterium]
MQNMINWFEIPAKDISRAKNFYNVILGVQLNEVDMFGTKMAFFPTDGSNVSGAIVQGDDYAPSPGGSLLYLNGGADLENVLSKVEGAGGKVVVPKTQISPEMGHFAMFLDTEGNKMALHSMN